MYPVSLIDDLESFRQLELEKQTLIALQHGDLQPSGGIIRHRGQELRKDQIPAALSKLQEDLNEVITRLKSHDASCRRAHLQAARELGGEWEAYLLRMVQLLHCIEHLNARVQNEHALMTNTWLVITADNQVGWYEKKRLLKVCNQVQQEMRWISDSVGKIQLNDVLKKRIGILNWDEERPVFDFVDVDKHNWPQWCPAAADIMQGFQQALGAIQQQVLETLIDTESQIHKFLREDNQRMSTLPLELLEIPDDYPVLLPGDEHELQRKLDLWNRFQLAHGFFPALGRFVVSMSLVGGTIYLGFIGV